MDKSPQSSPEESPPKPSTGNPEEESNAVNDNVSDEVPVLARVVDDTPDRVGSPFSAAPSGKAANQLHSIGLQYLGPFQYTAMGGFVAAIMLLGFAIVALAWFPPGGCIIAALGCGTATLGLHSKFKRITTGVLISHACLFIACFFAASA
jgi:hypothetical protein